MRLTIPKDTYTTINAMVGTQKVQHSFTSPELQVIMELIDQAEGGNFSPHDHDRRLCYFEVRRKMRQFRKAVEASQE